MPLQKISTITLSGSGSDIRCFAIDNIRGFLYAGTDNGYVKRIRLSDFSYIDELNIESPSTILACTIDEVNGIGYFGSALGNIYKLDLPTFTSLGSIGTGGSTLRSASIDTTRNRVYFGKSVNCLAAIIRKSDFTYLGDINPGTGDFELFSSVADTINGFTYWGTWGSVTFPPKVIKNNTSNDTNSGFIIISGLSTTFRILTGAGIDIPNGFAYIGVDSSPVVVIKVKLSPLSQIGNLQLKSGEDGLQSDFQIKSGFLYGATFNPPVVIKIDLSTFTETESLSLDPSEANIGASAIDAVNNFLYFGTGGNKVIKVLIPSEVSLPSKKQILGNISKLGYVKRGALINRPSGKGASFS